MIFVEELTEDDKGRYVVYIDGTGEECRGRIKSWNDKWIFVVYNCADEWDDYTNYTAAATEPSDLKFEEPKHGENRKADDKIDRFEILDFRNNDGQ